jgi:hypothetical protein
MLYLGRVLLGYCTGVLSYVVSHDNPLIHSHFAPDFGSLFWFSSFEFYLINVKQHYARHMIDVAS